MEKIRLGLAGLGARCRENVKMIAHMDGIEITAIADSHMPSVKQMSEILENENCRPKEFSDYHEMLTAGIINAVLIQTGWEDHISLAMDAMEEGIAVGMEVGGIYDVQQCWDLVNTWERTKTPFMFLENCCYGRYELLVLNMVRKGLFGEIVHCDGGYGHDLRVHLSRDWHYRHTNYVKRNGENYPSHEIGPISKVLKINHGNRFLTINSVASKAAGMKAYIEKNHSDNPILMNARFNQGDIITTIIKCANGETINLKLDTTLPRFYSRNFNVHGTKALYNDDTKSLIMDGQYEEDWSNLNNHWGSADEALKDHEHPIWQQNLKAGTSGGHGGMDGLVYQAFFDALLNNRPMPVDVYDAAAWLVITPLSEQSVAMGGAPVAFPDFTRGKWMYDKVVENPGPYNLD